MLFAQRREPSKDNQDIHQLTELGSTVMKTSKFILAFSPQACFFKLATTVSHISMALSRHSITICLLSRGSQGNTSISFWKKRDDWTDCLRQSACQSMQLSQLPACPLPQSANGYFPLMAISRYWPTGCFS